MRLLLADIVRAVAWLLAKIIAGAPLWASRGLYDFADWVEGGR